jgi:hypothetical protein
MPIHQADTLVGVLWDGQSQDAAIFWAVYLTYQQDP